MQSLWRPVRLSRSSLAAALATVVLIGCTPPGREAPAPVSTPPPPPAPTAPAGLTLREHLVAGEAGQSAARVVAVIADREQTRLVVEAASDHPAGWRTSAPVAEAMDALAVINGGYFSAEWKPLGLVVRDGQQFNRLSHNGSPVVAVIGGEVRLLSPSALPNEGVEQAIQCGPRLVRKGQPTLLKESQAARRSGVGLDADGRLMLAATTSGWLSLAEFAEALVALGCQDATNLDGGSSTGFVVPGFVHADGPQPMPTHLVILPREDSARP